MLQQSERLKEKYLFDLAFKLGKTKKQKLSSKCFLVYYLLSRRETRKGLPKCGFVVGLRVDKRATKRNLYKRRMREAYKLAKKKLNIIDNTKLFALICIANPEIKDASFSEIKDTMEKLLIRVIRGNL